jgi:hypothetical protein
MTTDDRGHGLGPDELTKQRGEAVTEGVKSLFLMNGGAVVALLAFLQAIWTINQQLARWVIGAIALFSAGVFLAGCVQLLRYSASYNLQGGNRRWMIYRRLYLGCAYASLAAFFFGVVVVLSGAWRSLN